MLGALPPIGTFVTSYKVHPFVGLIADELDFTPNPSEVETVLPFRLDALREPSRCAAGPARGADPHPHLRGRRPPDLGRDGAHPRRAAGAAAGLDVLLDRDVDQVAPLGPGAVVVLDVVLAEQLVQDEPGVRGALADPAVGDHRLAVLEHAGLGVELAQLVGRLNVPSSLTAWAQGTEAAPGMWPPRCAPSCS